MEKVTNALGKLGRRSNCCIAKGAVMYLLQCSKNVYSIGEALLLLLYGIAPNLHFLHCGGFVLGHA